MKKRDLQYRLGVCTLILLLFIPLIFMVNTNLSGMATAASNNKAVQTIGWAKAGSSLDFEVKVDGVQSMTTFFSKDIKNGIITIEQLKTVNCKFNGVTYSQFKVSSADENKISNLEFKLKLSMKELAKYSLDTQNIKLYLNCEELPTKLTAVDGSYAYFTATSSKMGQFIIGKKI